MGSSQMGMDKAIQRFLPAIPSRIVMNCFFVDKAG